MQHLNYYTFPRSVKYAKATYIAIIICIWLRFCLNCFKYNTTQPENPKQVEMFALLFFHELLKV